MTILKSLHYSSIPSSKWTFEFTGPNQILILFFIIISPVENISNFTWTSCQEYPTHILFFIVISMESFTGYSWILWLKSNNETYSKLFKILQECWKDQDNVSEWSDMFTHGLLFQWTSTIRIQLRCWSSTQWASSLIIIYYT
jgi:hypothetical protein